MIGFECSFDEFIDAWNKLKAGGSLRIGNIFANAHELRKMFGKQKCRLITGKGALFLLRPWHDNMHELHFLARDIETLAENIHLLVDAPQLHLSITGKEPLISSLHDLFCANGFTRKAKLLRTLLKKPRPAILSAMRSFSEQYSNCVSFAVPEDATEIMEILKESFDTTKDNIPLYDEICDAAANEWIAVLKQDGQIAALQYFTITGTTINYIYDVTRPQWRGSNGLFPALAVWVHDELEKRQLSISRAYGWRAENKKRLVKHAKECNQQFDGMVIYNLHKAMPHQSNHM